MPTEQQLLHSCEILFGSQLTISREFLDYLQPSGVKSAYRKRAMETHPDRLAGQGQVPHPLNTLSFPMVQEAYEHLLCFLKAREERRSRAGSRIPDAAASSVRRQGTQEHPSGNGGPPPPPFRQGTKRAAFAHKPLQDHAATDIERLYQGPLPRRHLRFGRFLYYSGLISWRTIACILTWQRIERPRLGELGHRLGMLRPEDIAFILRNKAPFQPFGQTAKQLGILNEYQLRILIAQQQRLQKKFGTILLEKNIVDQFELQNLLYKFEQHNATVNGCRGI